MPPPTLPEHRGLTAVARSLRALEVLQTRPGTTAAELGERLGVSDRAARQEEALGLVMAVLAGQPEAADRADLVGAALAKGLRALPPPVSAAAAVLAEHAAAAPDRRAQERPRPATLGALVAAAAAYERVVLDYRGESGRQWSGLVDPWAVVVRHGRWYLLCRSHLADGVRTYRVDRIRSVGSTGQRFTPPVDLDPLAELEHHLGVGWEFPTRVVFAAPSREVARWLRPPMGRLESLADGGCVLVGSTSNPDMYAQEWLSTVPLPFRVEGGPELRAAVRALADRLAAAVVEMR